MVLEDTFLYEEKFFGFNIVSYYLKSLLFLAASSKQHTQITEFLLVSNSLGDCEIRCIYN